MAQASRSAGCTLSPTLRPKWRFTEDGKAIEHWDVLQPIPETTASGNDMFSQQS